MKGIDFSRPALSHNPFITPEGYFSSFTQCMMQRIMQTNEAKNTQMSIIRWVPWLGAACVAALLLLFGQLNSSVNAVDKSGYFATKSEAAITNSNSDIAYDYIMTSDNKNWAYGNDD